MRFALLLAPLMLALPEMVPAVELKSPDGRIVVDFNLGDDGGLVYSVSYRGKPVVLESRLGLELEAQPPLKVGFRLLNEARGSRHETWKPVYGERSAIRDHYRQLAVDLEDQQQPPRRLQLTFRAYNEGVAFCYTLPRQRALQKIKISR